MYAELMRICKTCKNEKSTQDFYFNKTKNSWFSECKECNKSRSSKWNRDNKEQYLSNGARHRKENPGLYIEYKSREYLKNKEKYSKYSKEYRKSARGKATRLHLNRMRELGKKRATPKWLTAEQKEQIKQFYINRPEGYHVDHIIPLNGKNVSGLHVPWNLQYLPAKENIKKRNRY